MLRRDQEFGFTHILWNVTRLGLPSCIPGVGVYLGVYLDQLLKLGPIGHVITTELIDNCNRELQKFGASEN